MKTAMKAEAMRMSNMSLTLATILQAPTPPSRASVSNTTGLTRATVSRLVDSLLDANLIEELEPTHVTPGRPALPLRPKPGAHCVIAVSVMPISITACVMDLGGELMIERQLDGPGVESDPAEVFDQINTLVASLDIPESTKVTAFALTLPGIVSQTFAHKVPNLGWSDLDICDYLDIPFEVPVILLNEADAAGYTKLYDVPGRMNEVTSFVYIASNTGVGSGIFIDGHLFRGSHGWAGEIGHLLVNPDGPKCRCGSTGCLERYIGYDTLITNAHMPEDTTPTEVMQAWERGETAIVEALNMAGLKLGRAIANTANLMDLETVYLGGYLGVFYPAMKEWMEAELALRTLSLRRSSLHIHAANDTVDVAARGACYAAFTHVISHLERLVEPAA